MISGRFYKFKNRHLKGLISSSSKDCTAKEKGSYFNLIKAKSTKKTERLKQVTTRAMAPASSAVTHHYFIIVMSPSQAGWSHSSACDLFLSPQKKNFILKYFSSPFFPVSHQKQLSNWCKKCIFFQSVSQFNLKEIFLSCSTNKTKYRGFRDPRKCKYSCLIRFNLVKTSN